MTRSDGLALFGGAFNPPHLTHRTIIRAALAQLPISELIVVPSGGHPFKQDGSLAAAPARLEMTQLAFANDKELVGVTVSDFEVRQQGLTYTVDTLAHFKLHNPDRQLFFILGSDNLPDLHKWRQVHAILELAQLAIYPRQGFAVELASLSGLDLPDSDKQRILAQQILLDQPNTVSATAIRRDLAAGNHPEHLDERVLAYVRKVGITWK